MSNKANTAEAMKDNRSESITRRPAGVNSFGSGNMAEKLAGTATLAGASMISLDRLIPDPDQPRKEFDQDALQQLADSLRDRGQLQPIRVRWSDEAERYIVVVGERRWRAAMMAGLKSVACVIVQGNASPEDLLEDQLVENAIRQDLKPIEQARSYKALMSARGYSLRELADRLHVHFTSVQKAVSLLDLPVSVQASVDDGTLAASSAHAIVSQIEHPEQQAEIAERVVVEGLNRSEVVEVVRKAKAKPSRAGGASKGKAKAKPRKLVTERIIRTTPGPKLKIEYRKGLDLALILAALLDAADRVRSEIGDVLASEQVGEQAA